jgi:hypothetical protein
LEAPGFTNFFLKNPCEKNQRQGFVEYLLDKQCGISSAKTLEEYTWEVDRKYSGNGSIKIMPAGNLDTDIETNDFLKNHLTHYIEGLARIDMENQEYITTILKNILDDIRRAYNPDVILIDSRTGLNDMMGISVCLLSRFVVGFFRNDVQSLPGLNFFLQKMIGKDEVEPYLINSILPSSRTSKNEMFGSFKSDISTIINSISPETELNFPCFPLSRNADLEIIGTIFENIDEFVELIKNKEIKDYTIFFESITERLKNYVNQEKRKISSKTLSESKYIMSEQSNELDSAIGELESAIEIDKVPTTDEISRADEHQKNKWAEAIKEKILSTTYKKIRELDLYAENLSIESEYHNQRFFFRTCMNDLFNIDKSIILGSKGTGKSYIYNALKSQEIVTFLKEKANQKDNYRFFYTIDKKERIFKVNKLGKDIPANLKYRFWLIYTWQIVIKDITIT